MISEAPDFCTGWCSDVAAFMRGGAWNYSTNAGVFMINYGGSGRSRQDTSVGFRCASP